MPYISPSTWNINAVDRWELSNGNWGGILNSCEYVEWDRATFEILHRTNVTGSGCPAGAPLQGGGALQVLSSNQLMRWDSKLELVWSQTYTDGELEGVRSIIELSDGSILALGTSPLLTKLDSEGNVLWRKPAAPGRPSTTIGHIAEGEKLSILVTAVRWPRVYAIKLDLNGTLLWEKILANGNARRAAAVPVLASDGNYIFGCSIANGLDVDVAAFKLSPEGTVLWEKVVLVPSDEHGERLGAMFPTDDGGAVLVASSNRPPSGDKMSRYSRPGYGLGHDIWLVKVSSEGEVVWDLSKKKFPVPISYGVTRKTSLGYYLEYFPVDRVEIVVNELRKSTLKAGDVVTIISKESGKYLAVDTDSNEDLVKADRNEGGLSSQWMILKDSSRGENSFYLRSQINGKIALLTRNSSDVEMRASRDHDSSLKRSNYFEMKKLDGSSVAIQSAVRSFGYLRPKRGSTSGKVIATPSKESDREMEIKLIHQVNPLVGSDIVLRMSSNNVLIEVDEQGVVKAEKTIPDEKDIDRFTFTVVEVQRGSTGNIALLSKASGKYLSASFLEQWRLRADVASSTDSDRDPAKRRWKLILYNDGYIGLVPVVGGRYGPGCVRIFSDGLRASGPRNDECKIMVAQVA